MVYAIPPKSAMTAKRPTRMRMPFAANGFGAVGVVVVVPRFAFKRKSNERSLEGPEPMIVPGVVLVEDPGVEVEYGGVLVEVGGSVARTVTATSACVCRPMLFSQTSA